MNATDTSHAEPTITEQQQSLIAQKTNKMNKELQKTAQQLVSKGIAALDERNNTCNKRFKAVNVEPTEENRRHYRQTLVSAKGAGKFVSGAILFDETLRQKDDNQIPFPTLLNNENILPGIKVDGGLVELSQGSIEKLGVGLEGLSDRLKEYKTLGAKFSKWRVVFTITDATPTQECIQKNAKVLAEYARVSQEQGIVPIVEPEVLMDGNHNINKDCEVTKQVQKELFNQLQQKGVDLKACVLKTNFVAAGKDCPNQPSVQEVAKLTLEALHENVPAELAGIVFLSGGISDDLSAQYLNEVNKSDNPWRLTFSYGRALQREALKIWASDKSKVKEAQHEYLTRAERYFKASQGKLN